MIDKNIILYSIVMKHFPSFLARFIDSASDEDRIYA